MGQRMPMLPEDDSLQEGMSLWPQMCVQYPHTEMNLLIKMVQANFTSRDVDARMVNASKTHAFA